MKLSAARLPFIVRQAGADWRPTPLPPILWSNTFLLLASSVALEIAGRDARNARRRACGASLAITGFLGIAFLIGQLGAWRDLVAAGVYLPTNPHSSFFYILTGVHAAHLVAALLVVGWLIDRVRRAGRGQEAEAMSHLLGIGATFWHFLGGLWLYLFGMLSLV